MNIYDFFNSRDIAAHCRNIGYEFTAVEAAYLIWHSNHHALTEKHKAWMDLIDTMPDEPLEPKWSDEKKYTLHEFLHTYMDLQNGYIRDFCTTREDYIYTYETMRRNDNDYSPDGIFFSSYETCVNALKANEMDDDPYDEIVRAKIIRHKVYSGCAAHCEAQEQEAIIYDKQLRPMELDPAEKQEGEMKLLCSCYGFYEMWIAIPTPFRKGDIVTDVDTYDGYPKKHVPMILERIPYWKKNADNGDDSEAQVKRLLKLGVDWTDMQEGVYFQDWNGEIYWDHAFHYLDLEYYRDELVGTERLLLAVSNAMQGKISVEELLRSHSIILMENYASEMRQYFGGNRDLMTLCGIEKKT